MPPTWVASGYELNPGLEPGTPSLRVKCSTTELIQHSGSKYRKKFVPLLQVIHFFL